MGSRCGRIAAVVFAACVVAGDGWALGPPRLVRDVNPLPDRNASSSPTWITPVDGVAYFAASSDYAPAELWRSDGTEAGTQRVHPIRPSSSPGSAVFPAIGPLVYFTVDDGPEPVLWRSDGTTGGTQPADEAPDLIPDAPSVAIADGFAFVGYDDVHGRQLWRADSAGRSLERVTDLQEGPAYTYQVIASLDGSAFFLTTAGELWRSDGTFQGTERIRALSSTVVYGLVAAAGRLWFVRDRELWSSDGTQAGTARVDGVELMPPYPDPSTNYLDYASDETRLFFLAGGGQLLPWASDGTAAGTVPLLPADVGIAAPRSLARLGDALYFVADRLAALGEPREALLWRLDDDGSLVSLTEAGPMFNTGPAAGQRLFVFGREEPCEPRLCPPPRLFVTDGTPQGTRVVTSLRSSNEPEGLAYFQALGDIVLFASKGLDGVELWRSDGTDAGTHVVRDIHAVPDSSYVDYFGDVGGELLFLANVGKGDVELWKSDGTGAGTVPLALVDNEYEISVHHPYTLSPALYAIALSDAWRSDSTAAGTSPVLEAPSPPSRITALEASGTTLYMQVDRTEIWAQGGAIPATRRVYAGTLAQSRALAVLADDTALFLASSGNASELWRSDGTEAGTALVTNLPQGFAGSLHAGTTVAYFTAGGVPEIWRTDGTVDGTFRLGVTNTSLFDAAVLGDDLFFAHSDQQETELWTSDGTVAGTHLLADLPGAASLSPHRFVAAGDRALFESEETIYGSIWITDGTEHGTRRLLSNVSGLDEAVAAGERTLFSIDGSLWITDGNARRTQRLLNVPERRPEREAARTAFGVAAGNVFFPSTAAGNGEELWAMALEGTPACPADCDGDGAISSSESAQGVEIALQRGVYGDCLAADRDADLRVSVDEIVAGVAARHCS